jgi:HAE1 family hydrophobic/amphiphilic exporter-1
MHHIEHGMSPKEATIKAMEEVSGPVIAIGLILTAVFVPVGFMGGITGRLYQQFAITIAISVLLSVVNALTLSPALSAMLLRAPTGKRTLLTPFYNWFNRIFGRTTDAYVSFTSILIRKMIRSLAFIGILVWVTITLVRAIPGGFVPEEDQGYLVVNALLPDAASLERTDAVMRKAEAVLKRTDGVEGYNTITGFSLLTGAYSSNMGFFFVQLKPWHDRHGAEASAAGITQALNRAFAQDIREGQVVAFGPPAIPGLGTGAGFTIQLQDRGGNTPEYLAAQTQRFMEAARKRPEIGRISTVFRATVPQIYADIDRSKVQKSGLSLGDVNTTLGALLGSSYVNDFNRFGRVYKVYLQAEPEYRRDPSQLGLFYIRNDKGAMVPLDALLTVRGSAGPEFTNRFNLFRSAELTGVPAPGFSSTQALDALEETAQAVLPADMSHDWADMSFQERRAPGVALVFALAIFLVFLILAAQYESWGLPFSVLLGTPFAAFGAYVGLWAARQFSPSYVNNVFAQIGLIMLIGLAAKNAILIVEFAKAEHESGKGLIESALNAAKLRFRPILMTAFAFILGVVPLLTATGAGAEARKVMGMTVFSGMLIATILGVCLIPVLFVMVEKVLGSAHAPAPTSAPRLVTEHGPHDH